jgi:hypothetical protein
MMMRLVVFAFLMSLTAAAFDQNLVTLEGGAVAQVCASCSTRQVRFPVTPVGKFTIKKAGKELEQPEVIDAAFLAVHIATPPKFFHAHWDLAHDVPVAIVIDIDSQINRPGTYDLLLALQPTSDPRGPRLKLQVTQPAAKLEVPDKIVVRRVLWFPAFFPAVEDKMAVWVRESTGLANLDRVQVFNQSSTANGVPVSGELQVLNAAQPNCGSGAGSNAQSGTNWFTLPAGCQTTLNYSLTGSFPIGSVTGSLRFIAPELSDPVNLNYEVKSGLAWCYVPLAILLGLWISYQIKIKLQTAIALGEARVQAGTLRAKVQADLDRYKDSKFHEDLSDAFNELTNAYGSDDTTRITNATTALDAKWREALQHWDERNKQAEQALNDIATLTASPWTVPSLMRKLIDETRQKAAGIREVLNAKDAGNALNEANKLESDFGVKLRTQAVDWQQHMLATFRNLANAHAGVPAPVVEQFKQELQVNAPDLNRIKPDSPVTPVAAALGLLNDLSSEYSSAEGLAGQFADRLRQEWSEVEKQLATAKIPHPEEVSKLQKLLERLEEDLRRAANDPSAWLTKLQGQLDELQVAWRNAFVKQLAQTSQELSDAITAQQFVTAAALVASAVRTASGEQFLRKSSAVAAANVAWPQWQPPSGPSQVTIVRSTTQTLTMPADLETAIALPADAVRRAKWMQSLLIGLVMFVWALGAYGQNWQGTWGELSTVFFAALGLDITLDAFQSKIKPKS